MSRQSELAELSRVYDSSALSNRNLIINGGMTISQRIGTTATAITGGAYGLDRWGMYYDGNSYTTQQVTDAPAGFYNSMKLTVTGTTTPNYSFFGQRIEGLNVNHLGLGTANCQTFTVSFYVKSSVAGVYSISMTNGASDLAYPVQYTINSADTWERKTMTIPPITSGTWTKDNTNGLYLRINLGSPSGRTDTSGAWSSGNFDGADGSTGAVTWATTSGATFYMTGCQIELGTETTPFEHRSYGDELLRCKRYYEVYAPVTNDDGSLNVWRTRTSVNNYNGVVHFFEKRAQPTCTLDYDRLHKPGVAKDTLSNISITIGSGQTQSCTVNCTPDNDSTISTSAFLGKNSGTAKVTLDAEL